MGYDFVIFTTKTCQPCKVIKNICKDIGLPFIEVYVDSKDIVKEFGANGMSLAVKYQIRSVPTQMLFKDKQPINTIVGTYPRDYYIQLKKDYKL